MGKKHKRTVTEQATTTNIPATLMPLLTAGKGNCADPGSELTIFWTPGSVRLSFSQAAYTRLGSPMYISIQGRPGYMERRYIVPFNEKNSSKGTYKASKSSEAASHRWDVRISARNRDSILKDWVGDYKINYDDQVKCFYIAKSSGGD